jgi:Rha family phage regulatory protein
VASATLLIGLNGGGSQYQYEDSTMCTQITAHPDQFIFAQGETLKTTSLKVAEAFGKQHKDVIRKLNGLDCSQDFTQRNFALSEYTDTTGRKLPLWEMTKDGFMFLVMGFTGKKAARIKEAYISAFNVMADQLSGKIPPKPALPAKIEPRSLYDLDYIQDLRQDTSTHRNVAWWQFERAGSPTNMAGEGSREQGEHFFRQTHELALNNPSDAEQAITWSLMHIIGGSIEGIGMYFCELAYCEQIARATVAWMIAAGPQATPPSHERKRGRRKARSQRSS